ncbi:family 78 glycoside hydrolase catalytic domain [Paenibacillus illinoisensis]|uniref:family 78 glycoside hydrolase catalytic domain n=1 Tax=Paenibacillus illinoisensis TaxID=59845 RepID=UPI001C8E75C5|nr:family 78 glycoside hydrolase catalytic domain [Paenibacillus illinoisensis]MBY0218071.1 family 78 glycoside hydrolase catalytic domain [Paenibacillus illinoisensis]
MDHILSTGGSHLTAARKVTAEEAFTWRASWIWGEGEDWPRNEWRCFRREFELQEWEYGSAEVTITADARYVLYVNGVLCGRGPNRSWPFELNYHVHEVGHLLRTGRNVLAVLVISYGVATFTYLPGRGGLLAQLESVHRASDGILPRREFILGSDESWQTALHAGYERRSARMSCQLGFAEQVDASRWDEGWVGAEAFSYPEDDGWTAARIIGTPGIAPWENLIPSDIPELTEQEVWPVRVESVKEVSLVSWTHVLDVREAMDPGSRMHANPVSFAGYAAAVIRASGEAEAVIGFFSAFHALRGITLNGTHYPATAMSGEHPRRIQRVTLQPGDNLLLVELAGPDHGGGLHFGIDCDVPFTVVPPLDELQASKTPFALIGPFATLVHIDHQSDHDPIRAYQGFGGNQPLDGKAFPDAEVYLRCRNLTSVSELAPYRAWIKPFPERLSSDASIFTSSIWKSQEQARPVPADLQQVCFANRQPAIVPTSTAGRSTELILDFGREWSGYLRFDVEASEGTIIDAYGFEYMEGRWRQDTFGVDNTLRYVCRDGRQSYESPVRRGLRYLMLTIHGNTRPVRLFGVTLAQSNYPVAEIGRFHCSDSLLNDIWEISKHTTRLCMEDTFVDCPAYEQVFWVGDSRNEALVNYYVFGATDIVRHCLQLVPGSSRQTPLYVNQVPSGWSSVIPNWTFFWVTACLEYARYTGSREFAATIWPKVKFTLDHYLQHIDAKGLFTIKAWNLLDWAPMEQPNDGTVTHQNTIFARTLADAAQLSEMAGCTEESLFYFSASESLTRAINSHLWSEEHQAYVDCIHANGACSSIFSMQTQVMALVTGIATGERREKLISYLTLPPDNFVSIGSPFMTFFYYEALVMSGETDYMLQDMRKQFGEMVKHEATTCWEMYPGFTENRANPKDLTRSHCHAWSAAPGYFLGASVLGVRPIADGWTRIRVAPQPGDLQWAKGAVPLPGDGRVDVAWQIREEEGELVFQLEVCAPKEITIVMEAPEGFRPVLIHQTL